MKWRGGIHTQILTWILIERRGERGEEAHARRCSVEYFKALMAISDYYILLLCIYTIIRNNIKKKTSSIRLYGAAMTISTEKRIDDESSL